MTELTIFESILIISSGLLLTAVGFLTGFSSGRTIGWRESNDFMEEFTARESERGAK